MRHRRGAGYKGVVFTANALQQSRSGELERLEESKALALDHILKIRHE
jgi:hypothetical protein